MNTQRLATAQTKQKFLSSGLHPAHANQAARAPAKALSNSEEQGIAEIHQMLPRLVESQSHHVITAKDNFNLLFIRLTIYLHSIFVYFRFYRNIKHEIKLK